MQQKGVNHGSQSETRAASCGNAGVVPASPCWPEWVRQGTESFFATQRILLDLVMRQNANTIHAVRERLAAARSVPVAALTEMAGEGISNFIAAQRVLLQLAQRQNEILMSGVEEKPASAVPPAGA